MVGLPHRFNGHELGRTLGDGEGQGGLACCSPWGCKESDTTERLSLLCPFSWSCYLTTSSSASLFSSCPQSFPASRSFPMSQLFISGGQSIGASAPASILPMNIQSRFPLESKGLVFLQSNGLSRVFSSTTIQN